MAPHNEVPYSAFYRVIGDEGHRLVDRARWATYPTWVGADVLVLAQAGKVNEALVSMGRYELYALTINSYSLLDSFLTLPLCEPEHLLFHQLPHDLFHLDKHQPLPLLPLSQEYSLYSFLFALKTLDFLVFWQERHKPQHDQRRTATWAATLRTARESFTNQWSGHTVGARRMLSRGVWNAAANVLAGHPAPFIEEVVFAQYPAAPIGGAHPYQLPPAVDTLTTVIHSASDSQAAFNHTLQSITNHLRERFPAGQMWARVFDAVCHAHLEQHGRMDGLGPDERRRILTELLVFYDHSAGWHGLAASAEQVFECLNIVPSIPAPHPRALPPPATGESSHTSFTAHSLGRRGHSSAPDAAIGLRTAKRIKTTPEEWAATAARRARRAY